MTNLDKLADWVSANVAAKGGVFKAGDLVVMYSNNVGGFDLESLVEPLGQIVQGTGRSADHRTFLLAIHENHNNKQVQELFRGLWEQLDAPDDEWIDALDYIAERQDTIDKLLE
jgi:hypothetical protein